MRIIHRCLQVQDLGCCNCAHTSRKKRYSGSTVNYGAQTVDCVNYPCSRFKNTQDGHRMKQCSSAQEKTYVSCTVVRHKAHWSPWVPRRGGRRAWCLGHWPPFFLASNVMAAQASSWFLVMTWSSISSSLSFFPFGCLPLRFFLGLGGVPCTCGPAGFSPSSSSGNCAKSIGGGGTGEELLGPDWRAVASCSARAGGVGGTSVSKVGCAPSCSASVAGSEADGGLSVSLASPAKLKGVSCSASPCPGLVPRPGLPAA